MEKCLVNVHWVKSKGHCCRVSVHPPLLENAEFLLLCPEKVTSYLASFLTLFTKKLAEGTSFCCTQLWSFLGTTVFRVKTQLCVKHICLALCLLSFGYIPEICSWEMTTMGTSEEGVIQHFYALVTQPCFYPHLPTTPLHSYTGMHVHWISKGVEDKILIRSYLAVCARNRESEESLVFSSSNSSKYTSHS